jgi:hypothetical protein
MTVGNAEPLELTLGAKRMVRAAQIKRLHASELIADSARQSRATS